MAPNEVQDTMRHAEHLRLINEVSCSITSILGLEELLQTVVTSIQRSFGYYYVGLSLIEGNNLIIKASAGKYAPFLHPEEIALPIDPGSCIGYCACENQPVLVSDVRKDPHYHWFKELTASRSLIAVPLNFKSKVIGILSAESDELAAFDEADLQLLESLGNHVAIAVVNAHTYRNLQHHAAEISTLLEMAQDLNTHLELEQLLRRLTERAVSLARSDAGLVFLNEKALLISRELWVAGHWQHLEWFIDPDNEQIKQVGNTGLPLVVNSENTLPLPPKWEGEPIHWILLVPIINANGTKLGLITLYKTDPNLPFLKENALLVAALANQAAIALENARLYALELQKVEALRELEQLKSNFLSSVSHDLRTPLTALKTCSEALLQLSSGDSTPKQQQLIKNINSNVARMTALVSDILEMAKLQSGNLRLNYERLDLSELFKEMIDTVRPLIDEKGQTLLLHAPHPLVTMGDRLRLEQVVTNLLSNANRYTSQGGVIEVSLAEKENEFLVTVSDDGYGVPLCEQERIFEQFYRISQRGKDRGRGSGLGLSIARSILELHGGRIWVQSPLTSQGNGTAFHFTLPKDPPDANNAG